MIECISSSVFYDRMETVLFRYVTRDHRKTTTIFSKEEISIDSL